MTRQQKRRLEREASKRGKQVTLTIGQLEDLKKQLAKDVSYKSLVLMLALPLTVLRDKYGFGKKRLTAFLWECINLYDSTERGYLSFDDMQAIIAEETGVKITEDADKIYFDEVGKC